ncbi:ATP-dependent helicase [Shewanella sp. Scap07]|uniref:ATP-dependent helicase n=1 Tax=Shewanella sp. Scap07 TaxID=2589987 RepID=UPI0015BC4A8C|nr:ATP-dependent helicase [Shewanella sp. Scap07]QLE86573.1 ATP-dependent helicase [Shewanella sp. Scap07]
MAVKIELNQQQRQAVEFGISDAGIDASCPLLVIAGAGTGKTNTLAHRAAELMLNGAQPERILLMTFARRAAAELASRASRIVEQQWLQANDSGLTANSAKSATDMAVSLPWMGTFHSIAVRLLREYALSIGLERDFTVMDRNDAADMLDIIRHELGFSHTDKRFPKKKTCLEIYSRCVNAQQPLDEVVDSHFPHCSDWHDELKQLFGAYAHAKAEQFCLDYDDLLLYCYHMAAVEEIAALIRAQFDYILVDEYQDTNVLQAGILTRLFPTGKGVTVVGDDAQSIYGFRCATVDNILNFSQQFSSPATIISLKQNYRSHQAILDLSNTLLSEGSEGYKVELFSDKKQGTAPKLVSVDDDVKQAEYIVEQVLAAREAGTELKQQAVLFRSSYHSDRLELELTRRNIPYVKYGGLKFLEASHVKDLLALMRWADNPKHKMSAFRVLKLLPGVGPKIAEKAILHVLENQLDIGSLASFSFPSAAQDEAQLLVSALVGINSNTVAWPGQTQLAANAYQGLLERNYEDGFVRWGDIEQLIQLAGQYSSRQRFLTELTLDPPQSSGDLAGDPHIDDDFLILSTVHSAKGQEWHSVFLLNMADGNFPNEYAAGDARQIEEERRLLNVAITRAKEELHLIQPLKYWVPEQQSWGDKHVYGGKSRFITDAVSKLLVKSHYPKTRPDAQELKAGRSAITDIRKSVLGMWDK